MYLWLMFLVCHHSVHLKYDEPCKYKCYNYSLGSIVRPPDERLRAEQPRNWNARRDQGPRGQDHPQQGTCCLCCLSCVCRFCRCILYSLCTVCTVCVPSILFVYRLYCLCTVCTVCVPSVLSVLSFPLLQ